MPNCGSQCWLCDLPIRFDTYTGCSHMCKYCFVQRKSTLDIGMGESAIALKNFIEGKRTRETNWCDWNIPIHWGGMSDPFQPCERTHKRSLEALKVLAETKYPAVISTKGKICIEEPYISLIKKGNIVMQVSMLCSKYDGLEKGAPTFEERLHMLNVLSKSAKRVIVRCQPYIHDVFEQVYENIQKFAQNGAYGVIFEGMKFAKNYKGLVKIGADYCQPKELLKHDFQQFKSECHKHGLKFYSGENRLRAMGDSLTCCGIDELEGFKPNTFNINPLINNQLGKPTKAQTKQGSGACFRACFQDTVMGNYVKSKTFVEMTEFYYNKKRKMVESVLKGE